jgi:hypothetical protein
MIALPASDFAQDLDDWQRECDAVTVLVTGILGVSYRCSSPRRATPTIGRTTL